MSASGSAAGALPHVGSPSAEREGRSLRRGVNRMLILGVGLQVLLVTLVIGTAVSAAVDGLRAVSDGGMEGAASDLLASMTNQQSGLLAYMDAPAQADTLLLYTESRQEAEHDLRELRAETSGTEHAVRAAHLEADARKWESWAEGIRQQVLFSGTRLTDATVVNEGRQRFSEFRREQADLVSSLRADQADHGRAALTMTVVKAAIAVVGSVPMVLLLRLTAGRVVRRGLRPLGQLASAAGEIAAEGHVSIQYVERGDEVGELARALQGWQEASAVRTILTEQAPVGICRIDGQGRLLSANAALERMLAYGRGELVGQMVRDLTHPEDRYKFADTFRGMMAGKIDRPKAERRWLRSDGSVVWCSIVASPVLDSDGRPDTLVAIIEDITERKREADRAAQIQRDLLPKELPELEGYELAAACVPVDAVAGDFYDWMGPRGGQLDLTVADVMGKGPGSALVMAMLRMALRAMPHELSPMVRVGLAARSMSRALTDEGLFVTMFHARLDLASGVLRYVDAGHGYGLVRRAGGEVELLQSRSLPLGVLDGEEYEEGMTTLDPGDALLVYTDGLVEVGDQLVEVEELMEALQGADRPEEMVARLVNRVKEQQADDVTALLLRRRAR